MQPHTWYRPIEYGADIVVHSATKFIGGHGTTIGGVIVDSGKFDWEASGKFASLTRAEPKLSWYQLHKSCRTGSIRYKDPCNPTCVIQEQPFLRSTPSCSYRDLRHCLLRVERHVENALKVVEYLKNHPQVEACTSSVCILRIRASRHLYKKYFPNGGGSIFTFEIKGDAAESKRLHRQSGVVLTACKRGRCEISGDPSGNTLHTASAQRKNLLDQGIKPNTIRLSIGTENIDDIIQDLDEAFKAIQ